MKTSIGSRKSHGLDPSDYEPFANLKICSNHLKNIRFPFEIEGGVHPLLIGMGKSPRVWLAAPTDQTRKSWKLVVDNSEPVHPAFSSDINGMKIRISAGSNIILTCEKLSLDTAVIDKLDLRPIGLNIFGNDSVLHVGGAVLTSNIFSHSNVAFGIGN